MAGNVLFYYFGDDEAYYRTLLAEFGKHTRMSLTFTRIFESEEKKIQSLFLNVVRDRPACIFIDFSKNTQDYIHLARIIARTPMEHKLVTVGLVDYLSPPEVLMESIATGVNLTHIKSAESYDVIFDVTKLISPNEIGEHGFATATFKETWEAGIPVKVGYVHNEGLHFETDYKLSKGDRITMNHSWTEKRVVPSRQFFINNISTKNLFYHFKYAVDAEFLFVDEFLPPEGMEVERIEERKNERDEMIIWHQKQLKKWISENESRSQEKKAKVLVVDSEFHFYDHQPRTDKHAYTIRCLPFLEDIGTELDRLEPQVIAFALDKAEAEPRNTKEQLLKLIAALKGKFQNDLPFLVVFNCETPSKEMQNDYAYPHLMSSDGEISVEVMMRMADIFDKKMNETLTKLKAKDKSKPVPKVFLKKTNTASIGEIIIPINILKLSETDMIIQTETQLPYDLNIHITHPVNMFVNLQPTKNQSKVPEYHGLIHSLGETQKKELRRLVNSIFFRDHDAEKNAETEEFKKLNDAKLAEKVEALKKLQEEEEKKKTQETKDSEENETPEPENTGS